MSQTRITTDQTNGLLDTVLIGSYTCRRQAALDHSRRERKRDTCMFPKYNRAAPFMTSKKL